MKTKELIIVSIVVIILSFPTVYLVVLLQSGNAKLVFKGDLAKKIEIENQIRLEEESVERDSLMLKESYAYKANSEESERITKNRGMLVQEQERLAFAKTELKNERDRLESERKRLMSVMEDRDDANDTRLKKLARVYGAMKAKEAARIMSTLQDSLCIEIFKFMGEDRQKAKIIAAMPQDKASRLSSKMGLQIK